MRKYSFTMDTRIDVWIKTTVTVTADSKEDIMNNILDNTLITASEDIEFTSQEVIWDTAETLEYDYSDITMADMEEVQ